MGGEKCGIEGHQGGLLQPHGVLAGPCDLSPHPTMWVEAAEQAWQAAGLWLLFLHLLPLPLLLLSPH